MDREKGGLRSTAISSLIFLIKIGLPSEPSGGIPKYLALSPKLTVDVATANRKYAYCASRSDQIQLKAI